MSSMPPPMPGPPPGLGARGPNLGGRIAIGCIAVAVIVLAAAGIGVFALFHAFQTGAFNCTPKDFPNYPGATVFSISSNSTAAGTDCSESLNSSDPPGKVEQYYAQALSQGGWQATGSGAELRFKKADGSDPGTLEISRSSSGSTIGVHVRT